MRAESSREDATVFAIAATAETREEASGAALEEDHGGLGGRGCVALGEEEECGEEEHAEGDDNTEVLYAAKLDSYFISR
jgi:hypothetical protein